MNDSIHKDPTHSGASSRAPLDRDWVEANTIKRYRTAGGTRPDLRVVRHNDGTVAVKDFKYSSGLFREIVGRLLIIRERGALVKLKGIRGVPALIAPIDSYAIAIEHIPHKDLHRLAQNSLGNEFYTTLREIVDKMHERGVVHCDLRTFGNVMVGEDGQPYIVDFAACLHRGRGLNPINNWFFKQFARADEYAVLKVKQRFSPALLTPEEEKELSSPLPLERTAKAVGHSIRRFFKRISTK